MTDGTDSPERPAPAVTPATVAASVHPRPGKRRSGGRSNAPERSAPRQPAGQTAVVVTPTRVSSGSPAGGSTRLSAGSSSPRSTGPNQHAQAVADAAAAVPGVARLSGGRVGEFATYFAGRRVTGVRMRDQPVLTADVHVVAAWPLVVPRLADRIRSAVSAVLPGATVDVSVDDVDLPETGPGGSASTPVALDAPSSPAALEAPAAPQPLTAAPQPAALPAPPHPETS